LIERAETVMKTENPWQAKKQVRVYNGDMRSKIYMESQDAVSHVFGPQFSKYFFVGRIYMRNKRSDKQLVVYTTSLRAHTLFYRPPDDDLKASKAISKASLSERRDLLQSRIGMQLASENLQHQGEAIPPTDLILTLNEASRVAQMASTNAVNSNPKGLLEVTTNDSPTSAGAKLKEAQDIVNRVHSFRQQRFAEMTNEVPKYVMNWSSLNANQKEQKQSEVTKALESRILKGEEEPSTKEMADQIAVPLSQFQNEMESELNEIRRQYSGFGSVMDFNVPISVMIDRQPAAFSADARQQALYNEHGFIWHDYYRPMTFQSVLSSLIVATEAGPRAQIVRYLETAGIIAGGLVGLSPVISEFGSKGYATAVAVSTAVFLPEARKLLLDDLNKYIKNLGDMGMDTVVVIPPNGVVDKYVFFPRGPIFYGIDEFSVNKPSYIVEVDNSDVAVEAILIEQGKVIETGVTSADKLVGEALNQGRSTRDAEELKLVKMTENLRTFRLTTLPGEVQKLIEHGNTNGAAKLVASVRTAFGPDQSGLLDRLVAEYNLDYGNTNRAPELTVSNIVTTLAIGTNQGAISVTFRDPDNNPLRLDFLTDPSVVTGLRISGDEANPIQTSFTGLSNRSDLRFDIIVRNNSAAFTLLTNRLSNGKATTQWVDRFAVTNTVAP